MPASSVYYWIRFRSSLENAEDDQYRLMELGALGAEEEDSVSGAIRVRGFFDDKSLWTDAFDALKSRLGLERGENPWEDWDRSWRDRQTPVPVTPMLTVYPPWIPAPATGHFLRLEAKMAFGTGSHESTRIAAMLLEQQNPKGLKVLDVGAGTGILSLYAGRLGAALTIGFDTDPVTGPCLRENLGLNPSGPASVIAFFIGTLSALRASAVFDLAICNMIRTEIFPLLATVLDLVKPGGSLIVSGQNRADQPYWESRLPIGDFGIAQELRLGDWWGFRLAAQD